MGDRNLAEITALTSAAKKAYAMAHITNPREEIDVAELHEISAYHELMEYEALGFCDKGEGASLIEKDITTVNGTLPVNPSGGTLSSNPVSASGLIRVCEAALQVMGKANQRQIEGVKIALAHATSGFAAQDNGVFILGKEV
jgi:acetyl-CoA C-acetyltransferase